MERYEARILNLIEYYTLEEEFSRFEDETEREIRLALLEKVMEAAMDLDVHITEFMYTKKRDELEERGIAFTSTEREAVVKAWDEMFDALVSKEEKDSKKFYSDQFRWHLFSFELLDAVKGDEAKALFDRAEKDELYLFYDYDDRCFCVTGASKLTTADIDELCEYGKFDSADKYFFDPKGKWCYVVTHEITCGPYFYRINGVTKE